MAAIKLPNHRNFENLLKEAENLCVAADIKIVMTMVQSSRFIDPHTAFREGKLAELKTSVLEHDVSLVVFLNNLSIYATSKISEAVGVKVIDRTTLILDIFEKRAQSKEAKLQVELARLKYDLPKVLKTSKDTDRSRGGVTNRGVGEIRSSLIKKTMQKRIVDLQKAIKDIDQKRVLKSRKRQNSGLKKVALVGYTNAGKSSLMNALLEFNGSKDKSTEAKDMLFATVDSLSRKISYHNRAFILFDTVGFVSDLPHDLVAAFRSTLSAVLEADLLLMVIDYANPFYLEQKFITYEVLKDLNAEHIPVIEVYNKVDLTISKHEYPHMISAKTKEGLEELMNDIVNTLYPLEAVKDLYLPYTQSFLLDRFAYGLIIDILEKDENGYHLKIAGQKKIIDNFLSYLTKN